jgi:hypothetical protein
MLFLIRFFPEDIVYLINKIFDTEKKIIRKNKKIKFEKQYDSLNHEMYGSWTDETIIFTFTITVTVSLKKLFFVWHFGPKKNYFMCVIVNEKKRKERKIYLQQENGKYKEELDNLGVF